MRRALSGALHIGCVMLIPTGHRRALMGSGTQRTGEGPHHNASTNPHAELQKGERSLLEVC